MQIHTYNSPIEVAQAVAQVAFVLPSQKGITHIAVSGGSTPKLLFEEMSKNELCSTICWENIRLYWVDERCVPPTDEQSNYRMAEEALLSKVPIAKEHIFRIYGENNPIQEADRYTDLVFGELPTDNGLPVFDVVILGMGEDGHTSSIFPHRMDLLQENTPYVATTNTVGQARIAMTGKTILACKQLLFHITGENKRSIIEAIIQKKEEAKAYPSTYLFEQREDVALYTDLSF